MAEAVQMSGPVRVEVDSIATVDFDLMMQIAKHTPHWPRSANLPHPRTRRYAQPSIAFTTSSISV